MSLRPITRSIVSNLENWVARFARPQPVPSWPLPKKPRRRGGSIEAVATYPERNGRDPILGTRSGAIVPTRASRRAIKSRAGPVGRGTRNGGKRG